MESLSAYARQFLDQMERPEVDSIEGLSPAIAIEQKTTTRSPRSTVGTITEIYDYLRVVFSSIGTPHCPNCGRAITRQSSEQIVHSVLSGELARPGDRLMILAPVVRGRKGEYREELEKLARAGFTRARIDGKLCPLDDPPQLDRRKNHTIEVVVDRLLVKPGIAGRLDAISGDRAQTRAGPGERIGGGRHRAGVFREAGVQRMRHLRAATRAALLQFQFTVWRLPGVQWPGVEIRFRSGQGDCGLVAAAI